MDEEEERLEWRSVKFEQSALQALQSTTAPRARAIDPMPGRYVKWSLVEVGQLAEREISRKLIFV